jgi:pimeloyl-ACP methyl ester carboxylesterase
MTTSATVNDELIELRGLRFHYRDWPARTAGARDLVMLHGFTGHARSWDAFAQAMTDRYRVLALDQRGHGESGWAAPDKYGAAEMVEDVAAFVAAMGLGRFALLGLSMGGNVAIHYAGRQPTELAELVIVDIAPEIVASGLSRIQTGVQAKDVFESRDEAFAAARVANPVPPEAHHRHRVDYSLMRTQDGRWTYRYDRALRSPGTVRARDTDAGWRAVANIDVPTLLVRGETSDILSPELAQRMLDSNPKIHMTTVAGAGHSVPLDKPDGFLAAVREFLRG